MLVAVIFNKLRTGDITLLLFVQYNDDDEEEEEDDEEEDGDDGSVAGDLLGCVVSGSFVDRHASLSLRDIYCINQWRPVQSVGRASEISPRRTRGGVSPAPAPVYVRAVLGPTERPTIHPYTFTPTLTPALALALAADYSRHDQDESGQSVVLNTQRDRRPELLGEVCDSRAFPSASSPQFCSSCN